MRIFRSAADVWSKKAARRQRRHTARRRRREDILSPRLETLEPRCLLAGDLWVESLTAVGGQSAPLDAIEINFSQPVQPGSFTLDDVALLGPEGPIAPVGLTELAADRYLLDNTGLTGEAAYQLTVGPQVLEAGGLPMDQDRDGTDGETGEDAFVARLHPAPDGAGPVVVGWQPDRPVGDALSEIVVTFDAPIDAGTFSNDDVTLVGPSAEVPPGDIVVAALDATHVQLSFPAQSEEGPYRLTIGPEISDQAGVDMPQAGGRLAYSTDFESGAGEEWSDTATTDDPTATQFLGRFGNQEATLSVDALPPHEQVAVVWDLLAIDSWDGGTSDYFGIDVEGSTGADFEHTFHYNGSSHSYPGSPDVNEQFMFWSSFPESIYRNVAHTFEHSGDSLEVTFYGRGLQALDDESWGIDNVRVYVLPEETAQHTFAVDYTGPVVTDGEAGRALEFDGTDDRMTASHALLNGVEDLSLTFWYKTTNTGDQAVISAARSGEDNELLVMLEHDEELLVRRRGTARRWDFDSIADGLWHHYAVVRDARAGNVTFYLDAQSLGTQDFSGAPLVVDPGGLFVGQEQDSLGGGFSTAQALDGELESLGIWSEALDKDAVRRDMARTPSGGETGLRAHWSFDDAAGTTVVDQTGHGFDGTLGNGDPATEPLRVDSAAPIGLGDADLAVTPDALRITYFDAAGIDPATATDAANYAILSSGGDATFGDGNELDFSGRIAAIDFDGFADGTSVASLRFDPPLAGDVYRLTIDGTSSVRDLAGNRLNDGADFVGQVTLAGDPAEVVLDLTAASDSGMLDDDQITADTTPDYDVTVNKPGWIDVDFDGDGTVDESRLVDAGGTYGFTSPELAEGQFDVEATLRAAAGDTASDLLTVSVDTVSPQALPGTTTVDGPHQVRQITFNEAIDPTSFGVDDVTFEGPGGADLSPALSVVGSGTLFGVYVAPQTAAGDYTMTVGPALADLAGNLLDQNIDGTGGQPDDLFVDVVTLLPDTAPPQILSAETDGQSTPGRSAWSVQFDEWIDPAEFTAEDVLIETGTGTVDVAGIAVVPVEGTASLQWADTLIDFSSQYGTGSRSAAQALGPPDTTSYGDRSTAWATSSTNMGLQHIAVGYDRPVFVTGVTVRETYRSGFVRQIELIDVGGGHHVVWAGVDPNELGQIADFTVEFPQTDYLVKGVKVTIDTDHTTSREQIDAIALHTSDPPGLSSQFEVTFPADVATEDYTLSIGPDVPDVSGNLLDQDQNGTGGEQTDVFQATFEVDAYRTVAGTLHGEHYWHGTVQVSGDLTIAADARINVDPGTVVKINPGVWMSVYGELASWGTAANPVVFTSWRDDAVGQDVTAEDTTAAAGDWESIHFIDGDASRMLHTEVRYGGNYWNPGNTGGFTGAVRISNADVELTDVLFSSSDGRGVHVHSGSPKLTRVTADSARQGGFQQDLAAMPVLADLTVTNSGINGITLTPGTLGGVANWSFGGLTGYLAGDLVINETGELTIQPGQTVKVHWGAYISVSGTLEATGTAAEPIVLTALRDDTHGGDTNADGPSTALPGDWESLYINGGSTVALQHVEVHFAGNYWSAGAGGGFVESIRLASSGAAIRDVYVFDAQHVGVGVTAESPTLTNVHVVRAGGPAFSGSLAASPTATNLTAIGTTANAFSMVGGTLHGQRTWSAGGLPIHLGGVVTIADDGELTIVPGQIVKLSHGQEINVSGTLTAAGTAAQPIVFTSWRDDTVGGDSNNDQATTTPATGDWEALYFNAGSDASLLEHVEVRYAGNYYSPHHPSGYRAAIQMIDSDATLRHVRVKDVDNSGIYLNLGTPTLENVHITGARWHAIFAESAAEATMTAVTAADNFSDAYCIRGGTLSADRTWNLTTMPIVFYGSLTVADGGRLKLEPGVVLKLWYGQFLQVNGTLDAQGTLANPIVVTSHRDDTALGDTFNDGDVAAVPGEWFRVRFEGDSSQSVLDHVDFRYGGNYYSPNHGSGFSPAVQIANAGPQIRNSRVLDADAWGLAMYNFATPTLEQVHVERSRRSAFYMEVSVDATMPGVTAADCAGNHVEVPAGTLSGIERTWDAGGLPFQLSGDVTVGADATLEVASGQVIKAYNRLSMLVDGTLITHGTEAAPVVFTSWRDDSAGGDSNNNGDADLPAKGDWESLELRAGSDASRLAHTEVRYAGNYYHTGHGSGYRSALQVSSSAILSHVSVLGGDYVGLAVYAGAPTINDLYVSGVRNHAVYVALAADPLFTHPIADGNAADSVWLQDGTLNNEMHLAAIGLPYTPGGNLVVGTEGTLTLDAGVVFKMTNRQYLQVSGTLAVVGTAAQPVVFTSRGDDAVLGDTFGDGWVVPQRGSWEYFHIADTATVTALDHLHLRYAGNYYGPGNPSGFRRSLYVDTDVTANGLVVVDNDFDGIEVRYGATLTVNGGLIGNTNKAGVYVSNGNAVLNGVGFFSAAQGVWVDNGHSATITGSAFEDLTSGVHYTGSAFGNVDARGNWWDDDGGPLDASAADGQMNVNEDGQPISDWIDYADWLAARPDLPLGSYVVTHWPQLAGAPIEHVDVHFWAPIDLVAIHVSLP